MITAMVTRDLALPAPSDGGPATVVGLQLPQLPAATRWTSAMSGLVRFHSRSNNDQLASLAMGV
jgi:hypothetical protein